MLENIEIPVKATIYKKEIYKLEHVNFCPMIHTEGRVFNLFIINYKRKGTWVYRCDR